MKKLMLVLAAVAMAASVQAAAFKWQSAAGGAIYQAGGESVLSGASVYLFDTSAYTYAQLFDAFAGDGISFSKAMDSATLGADGKFAAVTTPVTSDKAYSMYVAIVDGDNLFVSDLKNYTGPSGDKTTTVSFTLTAKTKLDAIEIENGTGITGAGWYTTAVPEPTSGLLMLLGMAGLALKRKHA